jgi:multifunctional beta-oxidation protein
LHGACFMGIARKHVYQTFGAFKSIKIRFASVVVLGQMLKTEMWREKQSRSVSFQMTVVETGNLCIVGDRAELWNNTESNSRI